MSDRFYTQMCDYYKITPNELNIALRDHESPEYKKLEKKAGVQMSNGKKLTRIDYNNMITELLGTNIEGSKLPLMVLETMHKKIKDKSFVKVEVPEGRLKQPYIQAVTECLGTTMDLSTATVKVMKGFLEAINKHE